MESVLAIATILTVGAVTPGPNNFIVMAAGSRGGFPSAGPLMAGILAGGLLLLSFAWAGVSLIFQTEPRLQILLSVAGSTYLAWLGGQMIWRTRQNVTEKIDNASQNNVLSYTSFGVAVFQLFNPKAWVLILTLTAATMRSLDGLLGFSTLAALFVVVSATCLTLWALAGSIIGKLLADAIAKRWFDRSLGGLLVISAAALLAGAF